eukprot:227332_1
MSQDQQDTDNNTNISLQGIVQPTGESLANVLVHDFDKKGNSINTKPGVTSSPLSTQHVNNQCNKITQNINNSDDEKSNTPTKNKPKPTTNEIKPIVNIEGLSEDQTKALIALNLNLQALNQFPAIQTKIAKYFADNYLLHQQQYKKSKTLDDFRIDHILNYNDIFGCNKPQSRLYQVASSIRKRNDNMQLLLQTIQFLTLVQCNWSQKNIENITPRQMGQDLENIKLLWKAIYNQDLISQKLRNKTNIIFSIAKFFFFDDDLIEILNNPNHKRYKEIDDKVSDLKKTLSGMGNGFCMFDAKLNGLIKEASVNGFVIKKKKKKEVKKPEKRGKKRSKQEADKETTTSTSTAGSSPKISSPPNKRQKLNHPMTAPVNKTKNTNIKQDQTDVWSADYYSSQSHQDGYDGREKWYVNQSPNVNGYIDPDNNVLVIRCSIGNKSSKISVDVGEYVPHANRLYLDIHCEEAGIDLARGRAIMPQKYYECFDKLNINQFAPSLPKRKDFPVIIIIPQSYKNQIISHEASTDMMSGNIFIFCKLKKDSHVNVKNSLNSQMNAQLIGGTIKQLSSTISFEEYPELLDTMKTLKAIEPIKNKPFYLYYKEAFAHKQSKIPQFKNSNDENEYWQKQYELSGTVEKAFCKASQDRDNEDDRTKEMFDSVLISVGLNINTYNKMKEDLEDLEKRREIVEKELPPKEYYKTTKKLICCKCSIVMNVDDYWDISPPLCKKCSKKTFNNKDNKAIENVHPEQLNIGNKILGLFKPEQYVIGEVFSKYSIEISNMDENNKNNNKKKKKKPKNNKKDTKQQQFHHIIGIQFVDNIFPIKYYLNAPDIAGSSLKN